jgi:hypothetical protein
MTSPSREDVAREIERHRAAIAELEAQLRHVSAPPWPPTGFYLTFYIVAGMMIGVLGSRPAFFTSSAHHGEAGSAAVSARVRDGV